MARIGTAYVPVEGDWSRFNRDLARRRASLGRTFTSIGIGAGKALGVGIGAGLAGGAVAIKAAIGDATDLNEQINKNKVVFRGSEKTILQWSKTTAGAIGTSRREALEAAGVFGNMLVPMGFARGEAAKMSKRFVDLAGDLASFNNASPDETLDALRAGLAGETEPLRRFGVFLNDARLKQEALNLGLKDAVGPTGALNANAKAQATYSLILKDTADAQGDFARTSDSLANKQRVLKARIEDISGTLGRELTPAAEKAAGAADDVLAALQRIANRNDIDLSEKLTLSRGLLERKLRKAVNQPFVTAGRNAVTNMHLDERIPRIVEQAAPAIADAMASAAPRAAGAFVNAFKEAGPWGKLITVAFLASKLGAFSAVGSLAAERFWKRFRTKSVPMATAAGTAAGAANAAAFTTAASAGIVGGKGKFRGAALTIGRFMGPLMAIPIATAIANELGTKFIGHEGGTQGQIDKVADKIRSIIEKRADPGITAPRGGVPRDPDFGRPDTPKLKSSRKRRREDRVDKPATRREQVQVVSDGVSDAITKHDKRRRRRDPDGPSSRARKRAKSGDALEQMLQDRAKTQHAHALTQERVRARFAAQALGDRFHKLDDIDVRGAAAPPTVVQNTTVNVSSNVDDPEWLAARIRRQVLREHAKAVTARKLEKRGKRR